ncbi:MAG: hypothetical protein A3A65_03330 [Candidatus Chisholmbacteria bacterium RIFCSPLOWO2_01_FULL_49_14]|uniref:Trp operon repressor homolog n=1 Tax=Candidatus Chisholmbacteria bacterium RIFCSPLOWO2_01_FULL_49_14 TaxID=1797593 RepID=A0A1G1W0A1_9BACT|nr:MAG: hypothetical protein A3A65_03330 [Candidatus Chisholmbacteria bacterium RIFCSPLOWO2_01_FULL_49_14]
MARVSVKKPLEFEEEQYLLEKLFLAFSSLGNWQEAEAFFLEFLTKEEIAMLAKRLELLKRIQGDERYKTIMRDLKVTAQTVSDARKKMKRADAYFERVLRKMMSLDRKLR